LKIKLHLISTEAIDIMTCWWLQFNHESRKDGKVPSFTHYPSA